MERLQNRAAQQKDAITQLKAENLDFKRLKVGILIGIGLDCYSR